MTPDTFWVFSAALALPLQASPVRLSEPHFDDQPRRNDAECSERSYDYDEKDETPEGGIILPAGGCTLGPCA